MNLLVYVALILISILVFWGEWHIFFQQDEWSGFGKAIYTQTHGYSVLFKVYGLHFTPLTTFTMVGLYNLFGLNHVAYAVFSIILQCINTILLYVLACRLFANKKSAFLAALVFVSLAASQQAVTWYSASMSFLPSGCFVLIALIFFEYFLVSKKFIHLAMAITSTIVALGFRENAIFLLAYFPLRSLIIKHASFLTIVVCCIGAGILYGIFRFLPSAATTADVGTLSSLVAPSDRSVFDILEASFKLFIVSSPQLAVPREIVIALGRFFYDSNVFSPSQSLAARVFVETTFLKYVYSVLFAGLFFFLLAFGYLFKKVISIPQKVLSWSVFIALSIVPFFFLPAGSTMESRHFYISAIGWSVLLSYVIWHMWERSSQFGRIIITVCMLFYVGLNVSLIRLEIWRQVKTSSVRVSFIKQLQRVYPSRLPDKTIFYTQGELPFQSGSGQMFAVILHDRQSFDKHLNEKFLYTLGSQGYKNIDGIGYGYFTSMTSLLQVYCTEKLSPENVFSLSWDHINEKLTDTTSEIRSMLVCAQE